MFTNKIGRLQTTGDVSTRLKFADTLERIAAEGPDVFYRGKLAKDMVSEIQEAGRNQSISQRSIPKTI